MKINKLGLLSTGLGLMLAQTLSFAGTAWTPSNGSQYVKDQILVKFKSGVTAASRAQIAQGLGASTVQAVGNQSDMVVASLMPGQTVEQAVTTYANDPNVAYAQPNYIYHTQAVPTDPQYAAGQIWAAKNTGQTMLTGTYPVATGTTGADLNLESAWDIQTDCSSVVVAVLDTGINYNSTDLANNMWTSVTDTLHGRNFAPDVATGVNSDPMDLAGHGTHVAGIIAAQANNGIAGVGVCWTAKLMAVRVLDATGSGTTATIIPGINYAVTNGAKVINMSLGGTGAYDAAYSAAITNALNNDVLVVVAAGNDNQDNDTTPHWPCNFTQSNLICVAALDQNDALATFSDYGSTSVDVGAPGTNIYSTWAGTTTLITDFHVVDYPTAGTLAVAPVGWTYSSTSATGWGGSAGGGLFTPAASWSTANYVASTDARAYKSFSLTGYSAALLQVGAAVNVQNGDTFDVNYSSAGGDPFAAGTNVASLTNRYDGVLTYTTYAELNITPCISATCSVGFQLNSAVTSAGDKGVFLTNFTIKALTNTTNAYNTINGTSMATPQVAGVAALVRARNPSYTYADTANAIKNGGRSVAALSGKSTTGKAVDARGALTYINRPTGIAVTVQ
ncbi:MAG TPA: S8 family serine peptidase [Sideroxyarcus sp.]|nr:S8 family serine peptidase [Sideroxyarcus sp.]